MRRTQPNRPLNGKSHLNGNAKPEIDGEAEVTAPEGSRQLFIGGRCDNFANFEGKIDEVSIYGRSLSGDEAAQHFKVAAVTSPPIKATATILQPPPPVSPEESLKLLTSRTATRVELSRPSTRARPIARRGEPTAGSG